MPPTLKETAMAAIGAALLLIAMPWIILAGSSELAVAIYVYQQVMR